MFGLCLVVVPNGLVCVALFPFFLSAVCQFDVIG